MHDPVALCFMKVYSSTKEQHFLSAVANDFEFTSGECVSDYLGFFGFGSGTYEGKGQPEYAQNYMNVSLKGVFTHNSGEPYEKTVLSWYVEIMELAYYLASSTGIYLDYQDPVYALTRHDIGSLPHNKPVWPVLITVYCYDGKTKAALGVKANDAVLVRDAFLERYKTSDVWQNLNVPEFNWEYYTQTGNKEHTLSLLNTLLRAPRCLATDDYKTQVQNIILAGSKFL